MGRLLRLLGLLFAGLLVSAQAHAECGGDTNCIAVSTDPTVAPFHSDDGVNRGNPADNSPAASASIRFGAAGPQIYQKDSSIISTPVFGSIDATTTRFA